MQGNAQVIEYLNKVLGNELVAVNQYFLHSRILKNWGLDGLAEKEYKESLDEMKHADMLAQRILLLEGLPNFQELGRLHIGEDVEEILKFDLELELLSHTVLTESVELCEAKKDYVSRELLVNITSSEEEHIDWLETEIGLVKKLGINNYLQANMG